MGNPAGVKRDFDELERRRLEAARLLKAGVKPAEVARRVGVHRQSVSRWVQQLATHGRAGLKRGARGAALTASQRRQLERALQRGRKRSDTLGCGPPGASRGADRAGVRGALPSRPRLALAPAAPELEHQRPTGRPGARRPVSAGWKNASTGPPLKKSPPRRHHRLHR
ncbi:helix-turn-helix domain-containing protein [bacterium]|nr:helix-turn-helix domain-containing protein [bacterium]